MTELHDPSDCAPLRSCLRTPTHNFSPQHVDLSQGHRTWGLKNSTLRNFQSWIITPSGFWRTTNILSFRCIYIYIYTHIYIYITYRGNTKQKKSWLVVLFRNLLNFLGIIMHLGNPPAINRPGMAIPRIKMVTPSGRSASMLDLQAVALHQAPHWHVGTSTELGTRRVKMSLTSGGFHSHGATPKWMVCKGNCQSKMDGN